MKKFFLGFILYCLFSLCANASVHNCARHNCPYRHGYNPGNHYSSCSNPIYLINKDSKTYKQNFANCKDHYMVVESTTYYYSDGSKKTYTNHDIYNFDGTLIKDHCQSVHHLIQNKKHYFVVKNNRIYSIINSKGETITKHQYSWMEEIAPNRFLVRYDRRYGVIDINENLVMDIKYQKFRKYNNNIFITKLNGYYGLANADGKILVKNNCEKIIPFYNTILLKRYGKYGLTDSEGKIIIPIEQNKIKRLGEYIIVEQNKQKRVYDSTGNIIDDTPYKKIRLERNSLYGYTSKSNRKAILQDICL